MYSRYVCPEWKVQQARRGEEPVRNPGPPRRFEVQPVGTGLPLHHRCGKASPAPAEEDMWIEASEWELRERREREKERRVRNNR